MTEQNCFHYPSFVRREGRIRNPDQVVYNCYRLAYSRRTISKRQESSKGIYSTAIGLMEECCICTLTLRSRHRWQPVLVFLWNSFACFFRDGSISRGCSSRPPTRGNVVVRLVIANNSVPSAAQLQARMCKLNDDEGHGYLCESKWWLNENEL
jgi:hypothetical protein